VLLQIGRQLRGDDRAVMERARAVRAGRRVELASHEEEDEFPVPQLGLAAPARRTMAAEAVQERVQRRFGYTKRKRSAAWTQAFADSAARLYETAEAQAAAELLELSLEHPRDLVKICAAAAYHPIAREGERLRKVLVKGLRSADELEREVAATALGRIDPTHPALARLLGKKKKKPKGKPSNTITLVHGTWAANGTWLRPGGDFFEFLRPLRPDLYDGADLFTWSGGYSDAARSAGADELTQWVADHNESGLDIMGHSHGANVILLATQRGLKTGKTILLSCPVHVDKYFPKFSNVKTPVFSVRVKLDLVIAADFGGQKFKDPNITEIVLPIWFDHSASHSPAVWQKHGVAARVGIP
jgi:hypothetical protein